MDYAARETAFQVASNGDGEILRLASDVCKLASEIRTRMIGAEPPRLAPEGKTPTVIAFNGYAGEIIGKHRSISNLLIGAIGDLEAMASELPPGTEAVCGDLSATTPQNKGGKYDVRRCP